MCGITGFVDLFQRRSTIEYTAWISRMTDALAHRGPDDSGMWMDPEAGVVLGHRRLSVIDLSSAAHQPMESSCGRYVIVFNGEIYNFQQLRKDLERAGSAPGWRSESDTEVLLATISCLGLRKTLKQLNGMFTFALWDRKERNLYLCRDRLGEKPLYFGRVGGTFLFASELKSMRLHPAWEGDIDRNALALFLRHNYIPTPFSIYQGISKLRPGHFYCLPLGDSAAPNFDGKIEPYWTLQNVIAEGPILEGTPGAEIIESLEELLLDAVDLRMVSDVPLGAFLSGGVDSSLVVALMQRLSNRPVKTFTVGFSEAQYDEAGYARKVADHLGTDHTEVFLKAEDIMSAIPSLPHLYDEPFSDSSQLPTFLISKVTREHVVVSLSGDGGDEFFGGYNRYFWGQNIWNAFGWLPTNIRKAIGRAFLSVKPLRVDQLFWGLEKCLPLKLPPQPGHKIHVLGEVLAADSLVGLYRSLVSHWKDPASVVLGSEEPESSLNVPESLSSLSDVQKMMFLDAVTYLPDDILVKVDRASMGIGLEARIPFLDHRVVDFAWKSPMHMKIKGNQGKWILRQILNRYVPSDLIDRPKMGFAVPIDSWLRGPLRDWAENLLGENRLSREGYFNPKPIRDKWKEHLSGKRNWHYYLWDILMFQAWLEVQE